uniref:G-protein coupled receptors family 1 profile domain-containing protein n=1 Tax=Pyxicephalus adspersus TaxID=30357 RepID=A0AAV3AFL9_PYXAD|nr:TPA: hypothetical protein GDO54_017487 [Pyxicephalus adspersus]
MEANTTLQSEFIILGFYKWPHLHLLLFVIFLLVYLIAMIGNLTIMVVISSCSSLHTPMYFFLCNLSILDITLISTVIPKLLDICLSGNRSITYVGCFTQLLFFVICAVAEKFLLAVMAYDRCLAICWPLRYSSLMNLRISFHLALISWGFGFLESLLMIGLLSRCSFITSNVINHLFCDLETILKMSTGSTQEAQMAVLVSGSLFGFVPLVFILVTYVFVIYNILRIHSNEGKRKAFSTCSSHMTVITIFLAVILRMYIKPKSEFSVEEDKVLAILYAACIPTLNPIIYSLRNKDVHLAIQKLKLAICSKVL